LCGFSCSIWMRLIWFTLKMAIGTCYRHRAVRTLLVLDIRYLTSKTGPYDMRWEKVERIKRILTGGTYSVPPKQLA
jgi:hypothetical protein